MRFDEVQNLLDKGFSAEFIMSLANNSDQGHTEPKAEEAQPVPQTEPQEAPKAEVNNTEERINQLENSIAKLVETLQANAIVNSNQPAQPPTIPIEQEIGELIAPSHRPR